MDKVLKENWEFDCEYELKERLEVKKCEAKMLDMALERQVDFVFLKDEMGYTRETFLSLSLVFTERYWLLLLFILKIPLIFVERVKADFETTNLSYTLLPGVSCEMLLF